MGLICIQIIEHCPKNFLNFPNAHGWTPLHILANGADRSNIVLGMVCNLLRAHADQTKTKGRGMTPFHTAVSTGNLAVAEVLMAFGGDPNHANDEGATAFDLAWANRAMRDVLLDVGSAGGVGAIGTGMQSLLLLGRNVQRKASQI